MRWIQTGQEFFSEKDVSACAAALRRGEVVIVPTDTVYGVAALATDEKAVERVLRIKDRAPDKPLPVQVASIADAQKLGETGTPEAAALMEEFWPGALTIVMPRRHGMDLPFQGGTSIGIRMPASRFCLAVIEAAGFLVVPSANPPGEPAPTSVDQIAPRIIDAVDLVVDAGACPGGVESTVVDVTSGLEVLREGAIPSASIARATGCGDG
jgi:L-threonylcarbamoyladenylate synthase